MRSDFFVSSLSFCTVPTIYLNSWIIILRLLTPWRYNIPLWTDVIVRTFARELSTRAHYLTSPHLKPFYQFSTSHVKTMSRKNGSTNGTFFDIFKRLSSKFSAECHSIQSTELSIWKLSANNHKSIMCGRKLKNSTFFEIGRLVLTAIIQYYWSQENF